MTAPGADPSELTGRLLDATLRIGALALLLAWCFLLIAPFVTLIAWAAILAVLVYPAHARVRSWLGGREAPSAALLTVVALVLLIAPLAAFTETVVDSSSALIARAEQGGIAIPEPPTSLADWPLIGGSIHALWTNASQNLGGLVERLGPQLSQVLRWLAQSVAGTGLGLLQFVISLVLAGVLLTQSERAPALLRAFGRTLAGPRGAEFVTLATDTVRSVARGVLGVAIVQSFFAGVGFLAVGLPGAGLWTLVCLLLAVIQIGPAPVLIGAVIWAFLSLGTTAAVVFLIWCIVVALLDNVLKPLLLGRGLRVPVAVIFVGAIGGLLSSGVLGLFVGPVVLSIGYDLVVDWLGPELRAEHPVETEA